MFEGFRRFKVYGIRSGLAACLLLASCSAQRPVDAPDADVRAALASIVTATGESALDRMQACGFQINWTRSWISVMPMDEAKAEVKAGDQVLQVQFMAPNPPGEPAGRSGELASWRIRDDEPTPTSGWATAIQQKASPLGSEAYLNC